MTNTLDLSVEANFEVNLLQKCYSCKDLELKLLERLGRSVDHTKIDVLFHRSLTLALLGHSKYCQLLTTSGSSWCFTNYLWTHSDKDAANP